MKDTHGKGVFYENMAALYLEREGLRILKRNFRCRAGEIDLIAREGRTLVFAEVKYRKDARTGSPLEAVGFAKQQKIRKTALYYLAVSGLDMSVPCRFDVIGIGEDSHVTHIRNAFGFDPVDHTL